METCPYTGLHTVFATLYITMHNIIDGNAYANLPNFFAFFFFCEPVLFSFLAVKQITDLTHGCRKTLHRPGCRPTDGVTQRCRPALHQSCWPRGTVLTLSDPKRGHFLKSGTNPYSWPHLTQEARSWVLNLSNPWGGVLTLTDSQGGNFENWLTIETLSAGRQGRCSVYQHCWHMLWYKRSCKPYTNMYRFKQMQTCADYTDSLKELEWSE